MMWTTWILVQSKSLVGKLNAVHHVRIHFFSLTRWGTCSRGHRIQLFRPRHGLITMTNCWPRLKNANEVPYLQFLKSFAASWKVQPSTAHPAPCPFSPCTAIAHLLPPTCQSCEGLANQSPCQAWWPSSSRHRWTGRPAQSSSWFKFVQGRRQRTQSDLHEQTCVFVYVCMYTCACNSSQLVHLWISLSLSMLNL